MDLRDAVIAGAVFGISAYRSLLNPPFAASAAHLEIHAITCFNVIEGPYQADAASRRTKLN
jgi:hypothetical protein